MKNKTLYKFLFIAGLTILSSCTSDNDIENAKVKTTLFVENFSDNTDGTALNTTLDKLCSSRYQKIY